MLRKLTKGINLSIAEEGMIYLWTTCSESETDVPLVFYTRKGAKQLGFKLVKVINMDNDNIIK